MIEFHNGHKFDFGCASGALAFDGRGWWYDKPWLWSGHLRPKELTIITKTLTYAPVKGNYRWWCPWRCVRLIPGGAVNAVALSNPGFRAWMGGDLWTAVKYDYRLIVSIMPNTVEEAANMADEFESLRCACVRQVVGLQINASCPNVSHDAGIEHVCELTKAVLTNTQLPVTVKLAYQDDYLAICNELDGKVAAFELINTVPWPQVFGDTPSPLARYGLVGGVSGEPIAAYSRIALRQVKEAGIKTPIISGGGIDSFDEVWVRSELGANAVVFGTLFMRKPWMPNEIAGKWRGIKYLLTAELPEEYKVKGWDELMGR